MMFQLVCFSLLAYSAVAEVELRATFAAPKDVQLTFSDLSSRAVNKRMNGMAPCQDHDKVMVSLTGPQGPIIKNETCHEFFMQTGIAFCSHLELSQRCCGTHYRYCGQCNDMPNGKLNGMPCKDYFLKTGHQHCRDFQAAAVCCSSRRKVCDNCFGDTAHVLLNNMTCEMLLETQGLQLCDHHLVVQHCCSTRAAMCECNGDNPKAQFFTKDSKLKDCTTIFQTDDLASVCAEPTILKSCCESFSKNCIQSPLLG